MRHNSISFRKSCSKNRHAIKKNLSNPSAAFQIFSFFFFQIITIWVYVLIKCVSSKATDYGGFDYQGRITDHFDIYPGVTCANINVENSIILEVFDMVKLYMKTICPNLSSQLPLVNF